MFIFLMLIVGCFEVGPQANLSDPCDGWGIQPIPAGCG